MSQHRPPPQPRKPLVCQRNACVIVCQPRLSSPPAVCCTRAARRNIVAMYVAVTAPTRRLPHHCIQLLEHFRPIATSSFYTQLSCHAFYWPAANTLRCIANKLSFLQRRRLAAGQSSQLAPTCRRQLWPLSWHQPHGGSGVSSWPL